MTDEQVDALILRATGMPRTNAFPVTNEQRAIFRAGMLEAARIAEKAPGKHWTMVATAVDAANAIRQAAGEP